MQAIAIQYAIEALEKHEIEKDVSMHVGCDRTATDSVDRVQSSDRLVHQEGGGQEVGSNMARRSRSQFRKLRHSYSKFCVPCVSGLDLSFLTHCCPQSGNFIYMYINQLAFVSVQADIRYSEQGILMKLIVTQLLFKAG